MYMTTIQDWHNEVCHPKLLVFLAIIKTVISDCAIKVCRVRSLPMIKETFLFDRYVIGVDFRLIETCVSRQYNAFLLIFHAQTAG